MKQIYLYDKKESLQIFKIFQNLTSDTQYSKKPENTNIFIYKKKRNKNNEMRGQNQKPFHLFFIPKNTLKLKYILRDNVF